MKPLAWRLPMETMSRILKYALEDLGPEETTRAMTVHSAFFYAIVPDRFRQVVVKNSTSFFLVITKGTSRTDLYARCVRYLFYKTTDHEFDIVTVNLLAKVLMRLNRLNALHVELGRASFGVANRAMQRHHLIRDPTPLLEVLTHPGRHPHPPSPWYLPLLHTLAMGYGPALFPLAYHRNITTIHFSKPLSATSLRDVLDTISDRVCMPSLKNISIHVEEYVPARVITLCLATSRPEVKFISVTQRHISPVVSLEESNRILS